MLIGAVVAACGGAAGGAVNPEVVPFVGEGTTQQSGNDDGPMVSLAPEPGPTGLGQLASAQGGRMYIAVFAGAKRTGGFSVEVESVTRDRGLLVVHARFSEPPPGALLIQVLTSPAQLISIDRGRASGMREAVLLDQRDAEVARTAVPQSQP